MAAIDETVYVIGQSRTNTDNAITSRFNAFFIAFEINVRSDIILDMGCTHTIEITERFLRGLMVGKKCTGPFDIFESEIMRRYHGSSQRAIIVSCKEAFRQYRQIKEKYYQNR